MKKRVQQALLHERKKIEQKEKEIEEFEQNPLILFSGMQYDKNIIPDLLASDDDNLLIKYQNWQYPYVRQAIIDNISLAPYTIDWDASIFPSPFLILDNGHPIIAIHPYLQVFERLPNENLNQEFEEFKRLKELRMLAWEKQQIALIRQENPFIDDDSITGTIKAVAMKGRMQKQRMAEVADIQREINGYDDLIERSNLRINKIEEDNKSTEYEIERLFRKFNQLLPLTYEDGFDTGRKDIEYDLRQFEQEIIQRVHDWKDKAQQTEQY